MSKAAGVAIESVLAFVKGERDIAIGTFVRFAAGAAFEVGVIAASVEKKQGLLAPFKALFDACKKGVRKKRESFFILALHVDDMNFGKTGISGSVTQCVQNVLAILCVEVAF